MASINKKLHAHLLKQEKLAEKRSFKDRAVEGAFKVRTLANSNIQSTTNSSVFRVYKHLETNPETTYKIEELQAFFPDIVLKEEILLKALSNHQNIHVDQAFDEITIRYKPKFEIKNMDQLTDFLNRQYTFEGLGVERKDIINCYNGIEADLEQLKQSREIIVIEEKGRKKQKEQTIFPNKKEYELQLPEDLKLQVRKAWGQSQPPETQSSLEKKMEKLGIP